MERWNKRRKKTDTRLEARESKRERETSSFYHSDMSSQNMHFCVWKYQIGLWNVPPYNTLWWMMKIYFLPLSRSSISRSNSHCSDYFLSFIPSVIIMMTTAHLAQRQGTRGSQTYRMNGDEDDYDKEDEGRNISNKHQGRAPGGERWNHWRQIRRERDTSTENPHVDFFFLNPVVLSQLCAPHSPHHHPHDQHHLRSHLRVFRGEKKKDGHHC